MGKLKELFKLYALYGRMDLNWFLQDRATCVIVMCSELFGNLAAISGVMLLALRFGGVGGLTSDEVLFMLGFYELADGLCYMLFGGFNSLEISRRVARGQLDHALIQPRPLITQLMGEAFMPVTGSYGFIVGVALTVTACARLGLSISVMWLLGLLFYVICHCALKIGQSYLYASAAFYKPVACEEISSLALDFMRTLGKYPLAGLPRALAAPLFTVLPVGLLAYLPALALLGKLGKSPVLALPLAVAAGFIALAACFFRRGLRHYALNSCQRYREVGHRR